MVTIEPQRCFVEQLAGSLFEVSALVPVGSSPESYDPSPREMAQLARSKAYFCIGHIGFENVWLDRLKSNYPQVQFFDNSCGIDFIAEEHAHEGDRHEHPSLVDPHTWPSPSEAQIIVRNMCNALLEIDPEHADTFRENRERLLTEIDETDRLVRACLKASTQKAFIIYHPTLTYFARHYGLRQYAIEMEGKEPSPEQLRQLVDLARRDSIRTVFIQEEFDKKNAELIARETGCRLEVINPLACRWSDEVIRIAKILADD
jgi:zinc transport system substrate-binding protein